jgi:mono/diheme cytochrome c family protein
MGKVLKWLGVALAAVVGLLLVAFIVLTIMSGRKANAEYVVDPAELTIPTDEASISEGERLVSIRACGDCHGPDFSGGPFVEDAMLGTIYAANLTGGENSATRDFTPEDWDRAIRHGVDDDGTPLWIMPSTDFYRITNRDLEKMIAYLETLPAVDQSEPYPEPKTGPLGTMLVATGQLPFPAAIIDHTVPPLEDIEPAVSVEYGEYLATTCTGCHRPDFTGGPLPGAGPDDIPAANLTPAGNLGHWTQDDFIQTLRTGVTPDGKELDPQFMPWPTFERMTDDELAAVWLYLSSLEPATAAN